MFRKIMLFYLVLSLQNSHGENLPKTMNHGTTDKTRVSLINQITGVYKYQFQSGFISGETYRAENILEIVKINDNTIYIRTYLEFFNGHICSIFGKANFIGENLFLFEDKHNEKYKLGIHIRKNEIVFKDGYAGSPSCQPSHCGSRGGFDSASFERSKGRPIKYMRILLNSREFKDSIKE